MKKKVAKKLVAGVLTSSMILSLTACGGGSSEPTANDTAAETKTETKAETKEDTTTAKTDEKTDAPAADTTETKPAPLSITVSLPSDDEHLDANEHYDRMVKEINEYTNMDVTWQWQDQTTYYDAEHLGLKLTTGDVADVLVVGKDATFLAAAEEGLFWDLTDYIDDYDNLATIPEATRANASYNGKMYGIPRSRTLARNGFGYRLDWLNNLGLKEPTTWENFSDMLYAFTYNDPDQNGADDTVGLGLDSWTGVFNIMWTWFGVPNEWGIDGNGDLIHYSQTDEYKTALAAFRELYALGVINNGSNGIPDFMSVAAGKARDELLRTGLAGAGVQVLDDQRKVETYFEDQGLSTADDPIYTLGGYIDTGLGALCYPTTGMNNMIAISTVNIKTEDQLRQVLGFLNDLNDGECVNMIDYGWEGVTYGINDSGYIQLYTAEELTAAGVTSSKFRNGFNQVVPYFTADANARPVTVEAGTSVITKLEQQLYAEDIDYVVTNYGASYTSQTFVEQGAALTTILSDAMISYIKGESDETALDAAIKSWWTAGGETVTAEMNELYHAAGN